MESPEWTPVRSMCCMTPGISTSVPSEMTSTSSSLPMRYWSTRTGFSILPERMISMYRRTSSSLWAMTMFWPPMT